MISSFILGSAHEYLGDMEPKDLLRLDLTHNTGYVTSCFLTIYTNIPVFTLASPLEIPGGSSCALGHTYKTFSKACTGNFWLSICFVKAYKNVDQGPQK